jgi:hypothetical protein
MNPKMSSRNAILVHVLITCPGKHWMLKSRQDVEKLPAGTDVTLGSGVGEGSEEARQMRVGRWHFDLPAEWPI